MIGLDPRGESLAVFGIRQLRDRSEIQELPLSPVEVGEHAAVDVDDLLWPVTALPDDLAPACHSALHGASETAGVDPHGGARLFKATVIRSVFSALTTFAFGLSTIAGLVRVVANMPY